MKVLQHFDGIHELKLVEKQRIFIVYLFRGDFYAFVDVHWCVSATAPAAVMHRAADCSSATTGSATASTSLGTIKWFHSWCYLKFRRYMYL